MTANKIEYIKKKKNMTYKCIANNSGLTAAYIYFLAKGKRTNPSLGVMQKISTALGEKVEKVFNINNREIC